MPGYPERNQYLHFMEFVRLFWLRFSSWLIASDDPTQRLTKVKPHDGWTREQRRSNQADLCSHQTMPQQEETMCCENMKRLHN